MKTLIVGDIFRPSSFANVNMHMAYYLIKMGHDITVMGRSKFLGSLSDLVHKYMPYKPDALSVFEGRVFDDDKKILKEQFDNALYFLVDPDIHKPIYRSKKNLFFTVWSHSNYPLKWARALKKWDEVWTPSQSNYDAIVKAGYPKEKLKLVPHGYEPDIFFKKDRPTNKNFRFGMCNSICNFKGADLAIQSFIECFEPQDQVELLVMSTAFQRETKKEQDQHGAYYKEYVEHINKYNKQVHTYYVAKNCSLLEMAEFYRSCDCILSPHRGDGFGLVALESLACGVPAIVSNYHGPKDYIREDYPYFVSGKMDWVSQESGRWHWPDGGDIGEVYKYFEPDKEDLKNKIKQIYHHRFVANDDMTPYLKGLSWQQVCDIAGRYLGEK